MSFFHSNLFEEVLVKPVVQLGANNLYIVSGYATSLMVNRHLDYMKRLRKDISINLIVGMAPKDGMDKNNHYGFQKLQNSVDVKNFNCNYNINSPAIHSKTYAWFKDNEPIAGFIGSANYTQNAFSGSIREVLTLTTANTCYDYYQHLLGESLNCLDESIYQHINFFDKIYVNNNSAINSEILTSFDIYNSGLSEINIPLVDATGEVPSRSGLNWGQRPGRNPNQAYISINVDVQRSGFFPERPNVFTVITDDDKQLICVRAQGDESGKGIHTTLNNALMGEYFRHRLGLANGAFVRKEDLLRYGRTDVTFYKIDEESYFMDFSVR